MIACRILLASMICLAFLGIASADADREALKKLGDFIGEWKGIGGPDKPRPDPSDVVWSESISWSWRFKGTDAWLAFDISNGKYLKHGELRYEAAKRQYVLKTNDVKGQPHVFTGKRDGKGYLTFERVDPSTGDTQQLVMNSAGDGVRFVYRYAVKPKGRTVFTRVYQVAASKVGESIASKPGSSGPECIVTGGKGTIQVSYKGKTYYVCCTGCRDAFNENPEKYINEAKK